MHRPTPSGSTEVGVPSRCAASPDSAQRFPCADGIASLDRCPSGRSPAAPCRTSRCPLKAMSESRRAGAFRSRHARPGEERRFAPWRAQQWRRGPPSPPPGGPGCSTGSSRRAERSLAAAGRGGRSVPRQFFASAPCRRGTPGTRTPPCWLSLVATVTAPSARWESLGNLLQRISFDGGRQRGSNALLRGTVFHPVGRRGQPPSVS